MEPNSSYTILVTVDLEDWFHVENLRPIFPPGTWDSLESRIERNTQPILDLFDKYGVHATFFVLGLVAERFPALIKEIRSRGHEIASHGYGHHLCTELSMADLRNDLLRSKRLIEDTVGQEVYGYRAPSFSVTEELIEILRETGHTYDSSYNSFDYNTRYGRINGSFHPLGRHCLIGDSGVVEVPVSNLRLGQRNLSWGGGGFFRFWPTSVFEAGVWKIVRERGVYVFYCHPWEIDPSQPRVSRGIGRINRFRHYCNLDKTLARLDHFLHRFRDCRYLSCDDYVSEELNSHCNAGPVRSLDGDLSLMIREIR